MLNLQSQNGINIVSYYAPLVFEQAVRPTLFLALFTLILQQGFVGRDAILMTGWNSLFYVASSIVPYVIRP